MSRSSPARERHLSQSLSGRQRSSGRPGLSNVLFRPTTLMALVLIGVFAFGSLIVLGGFAKDLRKLPPGQATPRSVSAVGYQALTDYLSELGYNVSESRGKREYYERSGELVIYTPSRPDYRGRKQFKDIDDEYSLIVLPKWTVVPYRPQPGEVVQNGWARKTSEKSLIYTGSFQNFIEDLPVVKQSDEPTINAAVSFEIPTKRNLPRNLQPDFKSLQYFDLDVRWEDEVADLREIAEQLAEARRRKRAEEQSKEYKPRKKKDEKDEAKENKTTTDGDEPKEEPEPEPEPLPVHDVLLKIDGKAVLIRLENTQTYVLSEPDLLNTMAFNTQSNAHLAGAIIDEVTWNANIDATTVDFDVTLHGIEANQNIIKLMVTPPFLAASLCLLAAGGLIAWQGFNRFGDPARIRPDYAQGPVSLAKTAAEFMEIANRAHKTGADYAALTKRHVASTLGFTNHSAEHIDKLLDAREKRLEITPTFAELKTAITDAQPQAYSHYAQELARWRSAMTLTDVVPSPDTQQETTPLAEDPST